MANWMKSKIIISIIIIGFITYLSFGINIYASSIWKYIWNNTTITIPVGESFDKYKDLPGATLYRDNMVLSDAQISYNTEGDWLFYSKNVNTTKCGVYQVWYKAYENKYVPGTCTGYKCLVTFYVKDLEKPKLEIIDDIIDVRRGEEYNFSNNINYSDNYSSQLKVDFSSNVDFNKAGNYKVNVKITDEGNNIETGSFTINVYDESIPTIECMKEGGDIYIPVNEEYNIKELFKAYDLYDGDITNKIEFPSIDNKKIGDYQYNISVKNSSGKETIFKATIHVVDKKEPILTLTTHSAILDYKTNFDLYDFKSFIAKLEDNQEVKYDNLIIRHNLENKVGNYNIWYEYSDGFYTIYDMIDVSLVSKDSPKIEVEDIVLNVDSSIDLYQYVNVIDESDDNIESSLIIDDSNVSYEKEGTYYASAFCMNSSGLSTEKRIKIVVKSDSMFSESTKSYSITSIILGVLVIGLVIFNICYILITRKNKISKNDNIDNIM